MSSPPRSERLARPASGLALLRAYDRGWLRVDLVAGLTVGAMLIPQSMAYAELAGMPPQYGFYAVLAPLVVYALVGTSRHLGVGPEPGTAILAATGGEDYALLAAVPPLTGLEPHVVVIGRLREGEPGVTALREGVDVTPARLGWEHRAG